MGQAKQRGSFEDRKAAAIERERLEAERRCEELRRVQAAKTHRQREMERQASMRARILLAASIGMIAGSYNQPAKDA